MSLTSFLRDKNVKGRFRQEFKKPRFSVERELLAPPLSSRYSLVGTAFDYLLRFYVERLNPDAITTKWIAELAISHPLSPLLTNVVLDGESDRIWFTDTDQTRKARRMIEQAKKAHAEYLSSGEVTDSLLKSTLLLAQLDPIYRAGIVDENLGTVHKEDVSDLRKLISVVDPNIFRARELCLLNPGFGEGSTLVSGADVDLVIDDTIIDIKTTKRFELQRRHFDQLVGYYVLHEIGGLGELRPKPDITRVAIYFSRHAYLHVLELDEIIDTHTFPSFMDWFRETATRSLRRAA